MHVHNETVERMASVANKPLCRPNLKTRHFSTLHIEIFEHILFSDKTNEQLNIQFGYTQKSHCVVDHSRKVMNKLLVLDGLKKSEFKAMVVSPRRYRLWWRRLLTKHRVSLFRMAVIPSYYI
jgi:hypothetical protein